MTLDLVLVAAGVTILAVSSRFARRIRRALDTDAELTAVGHVLVLLVANTMQAVGVVMIVAGIVGG